MRTRGLWTFIVMLLSVAVLAGAAKAAAAQAGPAAAPDSPPGSLRARLASLDALAGPLRELERELRDGSVLALVRPNRVDYAPRTALREDLRLEVMRTLLDERRAQPSRGAGAGAAADSRVDAAVAALEREIIAASNAQLQKVAADRAWLEERMRQLREELGRLEAAPRRLVAQAGPPSGVRGSWQPTTQRFCPSPIFGKLLWSGSTPKCVGDDMALYPGSRFGERADWVCARCPPNGFFV